MGVSILVIVFISMWLLWIMNFSRVMLNVFLKWLIVVVWFDMLFFIIFVCYWIVNSYIGILLNRDEMSWWMLLKRGFFVGFKF